MMAIVKARTVTRPPANAPTNWLTALLAQLIRIAKATGANATTEPTKILRENRFGKKNAPPILQFAL